MTLKQLIREIILKETAPTLYAVFGSHRSREKAERMLGKLPNPLFNFRKNGHYYPISEDDAEKIKGIVGVKIHTKLAGNPNDWRKTW